MTRQGYGAEELAMQECASEEEKNERLGRFMAKQRPCSLASGCRAKAKNGQCALTPCIGCGAKCYTVEVPYSGHGLGCSLVAWWQKWDAIQAQLLRGSPDN